MTERMELLGAKVEVTGRDRHVVEATLVDLLLHRGVEQIRDRNDGEAPDGETKGDNDQQVLAGMTSQIPPRLVGQSAHPQLCVSGGAPDGARVVVDAWLSPIASATMRPSRSVIRRGASAASSRSWVT